MTNDGEDRITTAKRFREAGVKPNSRLNLIPPPLITNKNQRLAAVKSDPRKITAIPLSTPRSLIYWPAFLEHPGGSALHNELRNITRNHYQ